MNSQSNTRPHLLHSEQSRQAGRHPSLLVAGALAFMLAITANCGSDTEEVDPNDTTSTSDTDKTNDTKTDPTNIPESRAARIAIISSDFVSTSLSLLDPRTLEVEKDNCVNSGTKSPEVALAFSGDVVLPSQPLPNGDLILIDRANSTLTWVDPLTCTVTRQINISSGFSANPHDLVQVGKTIYVTRYEANPTPTERSDDFDEGSDLLLLDAESGTISGRIDLSSYASDAPGTVLPRPDSLVAHEGRIYVSLNNIGPDFAADQIGFGRVVVVDAKLNTVVETIDIPTLANCGHLAYAADQNALILPCNGNFLASDPLETSGVAKISLDDKTVAPTILPANSFGSVFSFSTIATTSTAETYAITTGAFGAKPGDSLFRFSFISATPELIFESSTGFLLGTILIEQSTDQLFTTLADENAPRMLVFDLSEAEGIQEPRAINVSKQTGLPPRHLAHY